MKTIESLQRWLRAKGFDPGPIDGLDGPWPFAEVRSVCPLTESIEVVFMIAVSTDYAAVVRHGFKNCRPVWLPNPPVAPGDILALNPDGKPPALLL